jgi:hypothetical protein
MLAFTIAVPHFENVEQLAHPRLRLYLHGFPDSDGVTSSHPVTEETKRE